MKNIKSTANHIAIMFSSAEINMLVLLLIMKHYMDQTKEYIKNGKNYLELNEEQKNEDDLLLFEEASTRILDGILEMSKFVLPQNLSFKDANHAIETFKSRLFFSSKSTTDILEELKRSNVLYSSLKEKGK